MQWNSSLRGLCACSFALVMDRLRRWSSRCWVKSFDPGLWSCNLAVPLRGRGYTSLNWFEAEGRTARGGSVVESLASHPIGRVYTWLRSQALDRRASGAPDNSLTGRGRVRMRGDCGTSLSCCGWRAALRRSVDVFADLSHAAAASMDW